MCLRHISRRLTARFREQAKLLETAVRYVCIFSAQSQKAAEQASDIKLMSDEKPRPPAPVAEGKPQVIMPPGVDYPERKTPQVDQAQTRFESKVDDLPDDETRAVRSESDDVRLADANNLEAIMRFAGSAESGRP